MSTHTRTTPYTDTAPLLPHSPLPFWPHYHTTRLSDTHFGRHRTAGLLVILLLLLLPKKLGGFTPCLLGVLGLSTPDGGAFGPAPA